MIVRSSTAASSIRPSLSASPTPMFTTILSRRGTCITFVSPRSCRSCGTTSSRKRVFSRGGYVSATRQHRLALAAEPLLVALVVATVADARQLVAVGADQLDVGDVDERL